MTVLDLAVKHGNQRLTEYLVKRGEHYSFSIFNLAIKFGYPDIFKYIYNNSKEYIKSEKQKEMLLFAIENAQAEIVEFILEKGPFLQEDPKLIKSFFEKALLSGDERLIILFGNLLLPFEFEKNSIEVLNILSALPSYNPNTPLATGLTPLQLAAKSAAINAVKELIHLGANIYPKDNTGNGLLHLATQTANNNNKQERSAEIVDFLVTQGLDLDAVNAEAPRVRIPVILTSLCFNTVL